jgi:hypothetical protein
MTATADSRRPSAAVDQWAKLTDEESYIAATPKCFDLDSWTSKVNDLSKEYKSAERYPHIHFGNFLERRLAK